MIARENLSAFFSNWFARFVEAATSRLNLLGIIAAFLTVFGLSLTVPKFQFFAVLFFTIYLGAIAFRTMPDFYLHPANFVSQGIDVERLKNFIVGVNRVGLIGKQNVGKTTFLDLTVARPAENEKTDRPYAQIVALPDTSPIMYVAIIDSVGQRDHIQFEIQNHSDLILLFLDHSESSTQETGEKKRIDEQLYFVSQLIASKQSDAPPTGIIVVMNKADLWANSPEAVKRVGDLRNKVMAMVRESGKYRFVELVEKNCNHLPADASALLRKIRDFYGKERRG